MTKFCIFSVFGEKNNCKEDKDQCKIKKFVLFSLNKLDNYLWLCTVLLSMTRYVWSYMKVYTLAEACFETFLYLCTVEYSRK